MDNKFLGDLWHTLLEFKAQRIKSYYILGDYSTRFRIINPLVYWIRLKLFFQIK